MFGFANKEINGSTFHLLKIDWAVTGTLSWERNFATRCSDTAEQIRQEDFHRFIQNTCGSLKLRSRELPIYGKTEWGAAMRGHYNFLIGRQGTKETAPDVLAATMQEIWSSEHGRARIEPFDANRHRQCVIYQSKREFDGGGNPLSNPEFISRVLKAMFKKNANSPLENNPANGGGVDEDSFPA
jgi:hypothetical protein